MISRLSLKLLIYTLTVSFIVATVILMPVRRMFIQKEIADLEILLETNLSYIDRFLNEYVSQKLKDISDLALSREVWDSHGYQLPNQARFESPDLPPEDRLIEKEMVRRFRNYSDSHPRTLFVYYGRNDGAFVINNITPETRSEGYDPRSRPWYGLAVETRQAVLIPPYLSEDGQLLFFSVAAPVFDSEGDVVGAVGLDISLEEMETFIRSFPLAPGGHVGIYNRNGSLLRLINDQPNDQASSGQSGSNRPYSIEVGFAPEGLPEFNWDNSVLPDSPQRRIIESEDYIVHGLLNDDANRIVYYRLPYQWLASLANDDVANVMLVVITSMILVSLSTMVLAQVVVVRPISSLSKAVHAMGGETSTAFDEWTGRKDEIANLASVFVEQYSELLEHRTNLEEQIAERTDQLQTSLEKMRIIADYGFDWESWVDFDDKLVWVNPAVERTTGYSVEECMAMDPFPKGMIPGFSRKRSVIEAIRGGAINGEMTTKMIRKDGTEFWAGVSWQGIIVDGNIEGARVSVRDITQMVEVSQVFRILLDTTRDFYWVSDMRQQLVLVSRSLSSTYGYDDPEDMVTTGALKTTILHDMEIDESLYRRVLKEAETVSQERWGRGHFSGRWIRITLMPLTDPLGDVSHVLGTFYDLTESKTLQDRLTEAKQAAESAAQSKSDFLANMSHEIRTPMNAIIGLGHLLSQTVLDSRQTDYLGKIDRSAQSLLGIINDILDFSKIEAGKLEIEAVEFSLDEVIENTYSVVSTRIKHSDIRFVLDVTEDVPLILIGDPLRLEQVLINLATNAVKYTEHGEIRLEIRCVEQSESGLKLEFSVMDTGIGIPKDKLDSLWESFTQADTSTTRQYGGTGLGLSIVRRLVELMGGSVGAESEVGVGSTFRFTAWFERPTESPETDEAVKELQSGSTVHLAIRDETVRRIMTLFIKRMGLTYSIPEDIGAMARESDGVPILIADRQSLLDVAGKLPDGENPAFPIPGTKVIALYRSLRDDDSILEGIPFADAQVGFPTTKTRLQQVFLELFDQDASAAEKQDRARQGLEILQGANVLLVEDNPLNMEVAREILKGAGFHIEEAANGQEAVDAVLKDDNHEIDLVLMDLQMPILDGYAATRQIRDRSSRPDLPIIALTADAVGDVTDRIVDAGMNAAVTKPIDVNQLLQTMGSYLGTRSPGTSAGESSEPAPDTGPADISSAVIDIDGSLNRLQGNADLYAELLDDFRGSFGDYPARIRDAVNGGSLDDARHLIHTLKGSSANLGLTKLSEASRILEDELKDETAAAAEPDALATLDSVFSQSEDEIQRIVPKLTTPAMQDRDGGDTDAGTIEISDLPADLVAGVTDLLEKGDANALALIESWKEIEGFNHQTSAYSELVRLVREFEFVEAAELLNSLESRTNMD